MIFIRLCLIMIFLPTLVQATEVSIFAASSLTEVLGEVAQAYQVKNPEDKILMHFAGSQALAAQIEQGAPADLFISADTVAMERLLQKGLVQNPRPLVQNRLSLAVQPELINQISSIQDLSAHGLLLVIGNQQVPIGKYTRQLFDNLAADSAYGTELIQQVTANIVSEENKVKAIVAKLMLGEVDAGIVYQSDLATEAGRKLLAIALPEQHNPLATYPVALTTERQTDGSKLLDFLFNPETQKIFTKYGFLTGGDQ